MELYYSFQDKEGYMWFASDRGVVRYNGDKFETFTTDDGLVSNTVFKIDQDDKGRIWFLSDVPRLCYFQNGEIHQYKFNAVFQEFFSKYKKIRSYTAWDFDNDRVLMSTDWSGSLQIDKNGILTRPEEFQIYSHKGIVNKIFFKDGLVLNGVKVAYSSGNHPPLIIAGQPEKTISLGLLGFRKTGWIGKEHFFIAGGYELYISSQKGDTLYEFPKRILACSFIDSRLWLCIEGGGVEVFEINGSKIIKQSHFFKTETVSNIYKSEEGIYWFATLYSGVFVVKDMEVNKVNRSNSAAESFLTIAKRGNNLFLVNESKKVTTVNLKTGIHDVDNFIDPGNLIMIMSDVHSDELFDYQRYEFKKSKWGNYDIVSSDWAKRNDRINNYQKDIFKYGIHGVIKREKADYIFWTPDVIYRAKENTIIKIPATKFGVDLEDYNTLWGGGAFGVKYVDLKTNEVKTPKNKLLQQRVNSIHNSNGKLFFGTHGNGVVIKDGESIQQLSIENGQVRKYINKIVSKQNGIVWLMGSAGISKLVYTDGIGYRTNEYDLLDLNCEKINDVYPDHDYLYLATNKGIRRITGGKKIAKKPLPKIYLGSVAVGGSIIKGTTITLDYYQNTIVVNFDAVSFEREPVVFRYRLNKNDDWTQIEERFVRLNTLENGNYFFEIQASINGTDWTDSELLNIEILPPFWKTWWFVGLMMIIGIGFVLGMIALRLRIVDKKHAEKQNLMELKQKMIELQQEALTQQMNPHFIFNALGSVQNSILKGDSVQANKYLVKFSKLLRAGLNASRSQLIPLEDDMELMQSYLAVEKTRLGDSFTFDVAVKLVSKEYSLLIPPFLLQPIIENSIKHGIGEGHSSGNVSVSYIEEKSCVRIIIKDNGKGRKASKLLRIPGHVSHGSEIAFERIKLFNNSKGNVGVYAIEDLFDDKGNPSGTKVEFTVPIIRNEPS
ncbi:MAG: ligand-binding sensor domain-containing protein [Crocinitomicaceae bacterium]|jgi:ligand-binding sensor domain-containing protein